MNINFNILMTSTTWIYDLTWHFMPSLWGHKYHMLTTSMYPLMISLAMLLLLMTMITDLHLTVMSMFFSKLFLVGLVNFYKIMLFDWLHFFLNNLVFFWTELQLNQLCLSEKVFMFFSPLHFLLQSICVNKMMIDDLFDTLICSPTIRDLFKEYNFFVSLKLLTSSFVILEFYLNQIYFFLVNSSMENVSPNLIGDLFLDFVNNCTNETVLIENTNMNKFWVYYSKMVEAYFNNMISYCTYYATVEQHYLAQNFIAAAKTSIYDSYFVFGAEAINSNFSFFYSYFNIVEFLNEEMNQSKNNLMYNQTLDLFKTTMLMFVLFNSNFLIIKMIYMHWICFFMLTLGIFFLWSAEAITEGTTLKISSTSVTEKYNIELLNWFYYLPLFHNNLVWWGFKLGFILFIVSEIMLFFGFFWSFFHSALSPTIQIGAVWPPLDVEFITVKGFAIANTVILLTSGMTLTLAHFAFELIPQKWSMLTNEALPFTDRSYRMGLFGLKVLILTTKFDWLSYKELTKWYQSSTIGWIWFVFLFFIFDKLNSLKKFFPLFYIYNPFNMIFSFNEWYFNFWYFWIDSELIIWIFMNYMLNLTLLLASCFMIFQGIEYFISPVCLNTGVYGSTFYMITGLHGFHVFVGSCFLLYCWFAIYEISLITLLVSLIVLIFYNAFPFSEWYFTEFWWFNFMKNYVLIPYNKKIFTKINSLSFLKWTNSYMYYNTSVGIDSFECAAWYWHFVDVVWMFVFAFIYIWSHLTVLGN